MQVDQQRQRGCEDEAMAKVAPEFSDAFEAIYNGGVGHFRRCVINVDSIVACTQGRDEGVLDLEFLKALQTITNDFLPKKVFVRREMQAMFTTLVSKHKPEEEQRVLVGSPGIGKSVLLFLAALRRAVVHEGILLYVRKTKQEKSAMSMFFMEKGDDDSSVNILFDRKLKKLEHPDLGNLCVTLIKKSRLDIDNFYIMLDGPQHDDPLSDRLQDAYQALCTSAGFPASPQEAIEAETILVLNGWTEPSIESAMVALGIPATDVTEIYQLSGGRIRLALMKDKKKIKKWFEGVIEACGPEKVKLAITSRGASGTANSSDRLRTRFYDPETNANHMIVDSQYVFSKLTSRLESGDLIESYNLAKALKLQAARGWFYEDILNRGFRQLVGQRPFLQGWIKVDGTGAEGVQQLIQECLANRLNVYWVPCIPNFANIDAAIVTGLALICFQYTVKTQHGFDEDLFWEELVGKLVLKGVQIEEVHVVFVTPSDVVFQNYHQNCYKEYSVPGIEGVQTRKTANQKKMRFSYSETTVDADSTTLLDSDIRKNLLPIFATAAAENPT